MSNDDNELIRRLQALRRVNQDARSKISSAPAPVLTQKQQPQELLEQQSSVQRKYKSQPPQKQQLQLASDQREHRSQPMQLSHSHPKVQEEKQQKQKTKKCRGNRKLQRFKAKLCKRGLNKEEIEILINDYNHANQDQNDESSSAPHMDVELLVPAASNQKIFENDNMNQTKSASKRKREKKPTGVTTSMSQMLISNIPQKRQRSTTIENITEQQSNNKSTLNTKPKYLKVPDQIFKQMLSKSLIGVESLVQLLDTPEKLAFVRTYAHLLNNVFYLKLEQDYWEHYYNVCMTEPIWFSPLTKDIAKENNLCRFKFKTKTQLEKHCQLIVNRLQEAENKLNTHKQQQSINSSINLNRLSTIIPAFVRQGQHKLSAEFERKKLILQFDANDYRLVKAFYDMKPTENQIRSAKIIWPATRDKLQAEEEVAIFKQRIYTKRLPSSFGILDHSIDNIEKMLKQPALNQDKRTTLSFRRLKTIAQFKYDMMVLAITTAEETVRSHTNIIGNEKKKLIDTAGGPVPLPKSLIQLMSTIAARQTNMIQRSQVILKQKLSVFDDAPMVINMAGTIGARQ